MLLLLYRARRAVQPPAEEVKNDTGGGFVGMPARNQQGRRRRVRVPDLVPVWQPEHENDGVMIAAGIF